MSIDQKKKVLKKIVQTEADIQSLNTVRMELVSSGFASATLASGGGSRSYTRLDIDKVTSTIAQLKQELKNLRSLLKGSATGLPTQTYQIWW